MTAALDVMLMIAVALLDTVRGDSVSDYGAQDLIRVLNAEAAVMSMPGTHRARLITGRDPLLMLTLCKAGRAQGHGASAHLWLSKQAWAHQYACSDLTRPVSSADSGPTKTRQRTDTTTAEVPTATV